MSGGGWDYYVAGGYENEDGWREATGAENLNGFVNLGRRGPERGISFQAFGAESRAETAGSLPESIFDGSPETNFTVGDFEDLNQLQGSVSGYAPLGNSRGAFTAYVRRTHAERFNVNQAPDNNVRIVHRQRHGGREPGLALDHPARANGSFSLRLGADGAANRVHIQLFEENPDRSRRPDADHRRPKPELRRGRLRAGRLRSTR